MSAPLDTQETIRSLSQEGYKYGFVTDIEADTRAARPQRRHGALHLGEEGRAGLAARLALGRVPRLARDDRADWAKVNVAPIDYQASTYYSAPKQQAGPKSLDEVDPELLAMYEKLGIPLEGTARGARRGGGRCRLRQRFGGDHLQGPARRIGHHLLLVRRSGARTPRAGAPLSRQRRAAERQFLRGIELGGVQRRLVRLHPAGRALPDGTLDLFPHQRRQDRPVRAHPPRSPTRAPMSAISKAAPRRSATKTSCMPRSSS